MNPERQSSLSCLGRSLAHRHVIGMLLVPCLLLGAAGARAAESRVTFSGSLASVPVAAGARAGTASRMVASVTGLSAAQLAAPLEFSVALEMRNLEEFQARIGNGELVPYEEVQAKYMPLQADYDRVLAWLKGQGFTPTFNDTSRLSVFAQGTVAQVQSSFGVTMQSVTVDGVAYTSAINAPGLPASVTGGVLGINGLQPHLHKQTHHRSAPASASTKTTSGKTPDSLTSANNPPFLVSEIRNAYNGGTLTTTVSGTPTALTGSGQKTAILIDALALHTDLTTFWTNQNIAQSISNIEEVKVVSGTAATQEEETLDEAWSSGIAPGSKVRVYASYTLSDTNLNKCLAQIQTDVTGSTAAGIAQPQLHEMSMSYGEDQNAVSASETKTEASYYATIANGNTFYGGVSIFASSGDDGSQPDAAATTSPSTALIVSYPAADVSITGVGGTDLYYASTAVNGRNWTEKGWGEVTAYSDGTTGYGGSGGGAATSTIPRPAWQVGTGVASGTTRLVPDLSSVGGPTYAYLIYNGAATGIYGTSWSSPTWAGFAALINQARALQGRLPLGALNRRVYPLIGTGNFYDTTTGNNSYTSSTTAGAVGTGSFSCTVGYDEVTGVGTPNLAALINTLTGPTITGFTPASGAAGTSVVITGTNFYTSTANPLTVTFNGVAASSVTINSATQITAVAPTGVTTGPIVVTSIGDAATSSTSFTVGGGTVTSPAITGFTPTSGAVGASVTITGTALSGATAVSFNGAAATVTSNTDTQIVTTVPAGATTGAIKVTTAGGTATSSSVFSVTTTTAAPTITSFTPTNGPVGTSVTITGTNLSGATAVTFGGVSASITSDTATQIVAAVPTGAATGTISVTTPGGTATSAGSFTVTTSGGGTGTTHVVISQVYGGSSSGGTSYTNDYIELFNPGTSPVDLSAYSVQYGSYTATVPSSSSKTNLSGSIPAQSYYLIAETAGGGTIALPAPVQATGTIDLSATRGFVLLASIQTVETSVSDPTVVDLVGYGTAKTFEGTAAAPAPSTSTAIFRANGGYTDTNDNSKDFTTGAPNPRNSTVTNPSGTTAPDLTVKLGHTGNFTQADKADTYTITVTNGGSAVTSGTVSVADTLPSGLTATNLAGTGWTVAANYLSATRSDALAAGSSYPALTLTVKVSSTAASSVTNSATVSGGGETNTANDTSTDPTTITALTPSQNWRYTYFGTTDNSGNAADTANPSGDGLVNLVKYALGLDPTVPTANPVMVDVSTGYLRLTTPLNPDATDVTMAVQVSGDLTNPSSWTTMGTTMDAGTTTTMLQVSDSTPVSGTAARFLRLMVTR